MSVTPMPLRVGTGRTCPNYDHRETAGNTCKLKACEGKTYQCIMELDREFVEKNKWVCWARYYGIEGEE